MLFMARAAAPMSRLIVLCAPPLICHWPLGSTDSVAHVGHSCLRGSATEKESSSANQGYRVGAPALTVTGLYCRWCFTPAGSSAEGFSLKLSFQSAQPPVQSCVCCYTAKGSPSSLVQYRRSCLLIAARGSSRCVGVLPPLACANSGGGGR